MSSTNSTDVANASKDELKTAVSYLSSLGRVGHRLAMLDTPAKLQSVLDKLLARLLHRIGENQKQQSLADQKNKLLVDTLSKIHQKLVEILSHAMKRVRDDRSVKLNCESILNSLLFNEDEDEQKAKLSVNPFTLNLSLAFLTLGIPRCNETELKSLMPSLIILHGHYANQALKTNNATPRSHWHQISHLLLRSLESSTGYEQEQASKRAKISSSVTPPSQMISATPTNSSTNGSATATLTSKSMEKIHEVLSEDSTAAAALYDLLLDIIMYQSTTGAVPPAGCSEAGQQRLQSNKAWVAEMAPPARLSLCKTRVLEWIAPTLQSCLFPKDSARTCTLLLAASGDANHQQMANQASLYLKHFLEDSGQQERTNPDSYLNLIMELLIHCVGCNNAMLALSSSSLPSLGLDLSTSTQHAMPFRRRMVSDTTFAAMMMHVDKILADTPQLFYAENVTDQKIMERIGTLTMLAVSKMVVKLLTSTGLTALQGRPYVSAVQVMNSLVIRFLSTLENQDQKLQADSHKRIESLLAKALALACTSLSNTIVATSSTTSKVASSSSSNEGNLSVRDALYGVICSLSRSDALVSDPTSWLFSLGKDQEHKVSSETATLLFACVAKEEQALLTRATAALDAVLAAFCRTTKKSPEQIDPEATRKAQPDNPWSNAAAAAPAAMETDSIKSALISPQDDQLAKLLLPLLWGASQLSQTKSSRLAAARWSSELLKKLDLTNACHILCFLAGDKDTTVASIARRGLDLDNDVTQTSSQPAGTNTDDADNEGHKLGDFSVLCKLLFSNRQATGVWRPNFWEFTPKAKASSIAYLQKCLLNDFYGGDDEAVCSYMDAMTKSLVQVANLGRDYVELLDECSSSLASCIATSLFARRLVFGHEDQHLSVGIEDIQKLVLNVSSSTARRELANACGSIYGDSDLWSQGEWLSSIVGLMMNCLEVLNGSSGSKLGSVHGAAFLGGTCVKHYRLNPSLATSDKGWDLACKILSSLGKGTTVADDVIGKAYTEVLAVALSYDRGSDDAPPFDSRLQEGAKSALSGLVSALRKYSGDEHTDVSRASKVAHAMGVCLEATIPFSGSKAENDALHGSRLQCIDVLVSLLGSAAYRKDEEIALRAGEALAAYAWVPKGLAWESSGADTWPVEMDTEFSKTLPPHQQVIYTLLRGAKLTSNPMKRTAYAPVLLALVARAAARVNHDSSYASTGLVHELCRHLDDFQSAFISILSDPKSKHLCRESCCLGLAACRSLAKLCNSGDAANDTLLRAFGQTTNHGTSAMQETRDQANRRRIAEGRADHNNAGSIAEAIEMEADVGGAAGMSEASLGAYREMAEAAVSLGRPDVLYTLFMLSVTHPIWFSKGGRERYGPSAILGKNSIIGSRTNSAELRLALRPHLGKIIPRLLRASHDPNKQTREQIQNLWNGLTGGGADARIAISQHLLPIIDSLIADTSHKLWRARVGATGALAQVIVGRSWSELGGGPAVLDDDDILSNASTSTAGIRLLKLWNISMRSLDDVRVTVRESGETLARGVRSLTLRLIDPTLTDDAQKVSIDKKSHSRDSAAAAATSLRWLVKHGLNQSCAEATGVSVSCLVGVIKVVNPSILQPLIPALLRSLLLAMSSLEPAALNYLQVRAAGQGTGADSSYGTIERLRLQVAQTGPLATAVTTLLDMVPHVDLEAQRAVIPQLNSALRQSAGFTTRAAVADACATLCNSCPNAFKFTGSNSTNPAVGLLRGFFHGAERESGAGARSKMAHAFGSLASLCPGSSVRSLALRACDNYNSATGANHDPAIRLAAAIALRSIAVRAHNQFSDGGNNDVWCKRVLPVSYLGMRDSDKMVAQLWKEVWEEGGSAANLAGAVDDYGTVLEEKLLLSLVKECDKALTDVSWSRRASGAVALRELADLKILAPLLARKQSGKPDGLFPDSERSERRRRGSQLALTVLVKLLAGSRLWSGKSEVAKAAVRIASNWSTSKDEEDEPMSTAGSASLEKPVILESKGSCNDLFVGDDWFRQEHEDEADIERTDTSENGLQDADMESDVGDFSDVDATADAVVEDTPPLVAVTFIGMCRLLITQAFPTARALLSVSEDEVLPYRAAVLQSLTDLLNSLDGFMEGDALRRNVYDAISESLLSVFNAVSVSSEGTLKEPPLVVARSLDCFAACFWYGIGSENDAVGSMELTKILFQCLEQPAWTVRESATLCCSSLVLRCHTSPLRQYELLSLLVTCVSQVVKDRKFWRVRLSGMKLLQSLVSRAGNASLSGTVSITEGDIATRERQEFLESMLPHKEKMLELAKQSLSDPEAKVTALASEVVKAMDWWP